MTIVIGLTGSIGTGKSMVADQFHALNIPVIDADVIARQVVEPGAPAYEKIIDAFGTSILRQDKTLNRPELGKVVFGNQEKRDTLNAITHPEIRKEMLYARDSYVKKATPCIVMDIPLLFESNLTHFVDKIIVVAVDEKTQLQRITTRDNSSFEEARKRIASQIPVKEKMKRADAVIDNTGTKEQSYEQLDDILRQWGINS